MPKRGKPGRSDLSKEQRIWIDDDRLEDTISWLVRIRRVLYGGMTTYRAKWTRAN